jgi:hypothetical protein
LTGGAFGEAEDGAVTDCFTFLVGAGASFFFGGTEDRSTVFCVSGTVG